MISAGYKSAYQQGYSDAMCDLRKKSKTDVLDKIRAEIEQMNNIDYVEPIDEAIERYARNAEFERTHDNLQGCLEFRQLAEWLKELKQLREQTRWIPVSERLPNFADVYRVTRYYPNNVMNPEYLVDACFFDGSNTWYDDNRLNHERAYADNVIAWQENPEPYEPHTGK